MDKKQEEHNITDQEEKITEESCGDDCHCEPEEEAVPKGEFEAMKQLASQFETSFKRMAADYQNLQRRTHEQKAEWIKSGNKELLLKLLPVLDTLMLAGKHITDKGLQITIDHFLKLLEQEGLTRIKTVGEEFNPHTMEAITTQEGENGKILEEVRPGFMLYDSVLRSAQVIVGKESN